MSPSSVAYGMFRHLYTAAIFGVGANIVGKLVKETHPPMANPQTIPDNINRSNVIYTIAIATLYLGSSLGKTAGAAWIPSHKSWSFIKPAAEMGAELFTTCLFGFITLVVSPKLKKI